MENKEIMELHFVKLGCRGYVIWVPHSNKQYLHKMESPQSTSRAWVMNLFKENGFPVSCKNSYWEGNQRLAQVCYLCPRHRNISKGIMLEAGSSRLDFALMLTSECTASCYILPSSFCCTEAGGGGGGWEIKQKKRNNFGRKKNFFNKF
jgi:hypothetical protein